jgi:hypothetical protein
VERLQVVVRVEPCDGRESSPEIQLSAALVFDRKCVARTFAESVGRYTSSRYFATPPMRPRVSGSMRAFKSTPDSHSRRMKAP